ncbi:hypothetical protein CK203_041295 [Vitis vinifera]|uniref:Uncharacterized protein n=1 Tax=Vitis vinifera TaxID=29760 RepID=A0A438HJA9_VITVI|nr:hypothetical protein CK203_041295 [Vitis vinifera]
MVQSWSRQWGEVLDKQVVWGTSLRESFLALYSVASSKDAWVVDVWDGVSWDPRWTEDTMVWLGSRKDTFSVKSFYSSLACRSVEPFPYDMVWNS